MPQARSQRGVALVVSLVLLAAMTILGVTTLSGTRLNEQIASNAQQKSIAFEAAESAIESVFNYNALYSAITADPLVAGNDPKATSLGYEESHFEQGYDLLKDGKGVDVDGSLSVQYCGEVAPMGTSLSAALDSGQMTAILVDIKSVANIKNSGASADHTRRVSFQMPQTGRSGKCAAP